MKTDIVFFSFFVTISLLFCMNSLLDRLILVQTIGRFIILGADDGMSLGLRVWGSGAIGITHGVWTAARFAAEGLAAGLRAQLRPHGVPVVSLHPDAYYAQRLKLFYYFLYHYQKIL